MGQQQLILLVLATVIVGVAIVVGIEAFTQNSAKANADAMVQDAVRMGNDVQAWYQKPLAFGGADKEAGETWADATLADIGYQQNGTQTATAYKNINGEFTLSGGVIEGISYDENGAAVSQVQTRVCGTGDEDILTAVIMVNGENTGATAAPACPTDGA